MRLIRRRATDSRLGDQCRCPSRKSNLAQIPLLGRRFGGCSVGAPSVSALCLLNTRPPSRSSPEARFRSDVRLACGANLAPRLGWRTSFRCGAAAMALTRASRAVPYPRQPVDTEPTWPARVKRLHATRTGGGVLRHEASPRRWRSATVAKSRAAEMECPCPGRDACGPRGSSRCRPERAEPRGAR